MLTYSTSNQWHCNEINQVRLLALLCSNEIETCYEFDWYVGMEKVNDRIFIMCELYS